MPSFTTTDGTELYYTDQGAGQPVLFSHGWPLSSDAWQVEIKLLTDNGYRAIAHDRRGHGRSAKTYTGNDMDTYAKDLAELVEHLDLPGVRAERPAGALQPRLAGALVGVVELGSISGGEGGHRSLSVFGGGQDR